jgi:hypothetical protein
VSFYWFTRSTSFPSFPKPVPAGTRVPRWAYIDTSVRTYPLSVVFFPQKFHQYDSYRLVTTGTFRRPNSREVRDSATLSAYLFLSYLGFPEVTGTASIIPTSTSKAPQSVTSSISESSPSMSHHNSNVGAIAGGVVGGIVGAALIAGVVLWFAFRRRHARPVFQGGEKEQPFPQPFTKGAPKLYVSVYSLFFWPLIACVPRTLRIQRLTRAKITCH